MKQDLLLKDLVSISTMVRKYVRTKKTPGNENPFPSHTKMKFRFRNTPKRNSVSTQNEIPFPYYITL
jgi:hypothetical protein